MNRKAVEPLVVSLALIALMAGLFPLPLIGCVALIFAPLALITFIRFVNAARVEGSLLGMVALIVGFLVFGLGTLRAVHVLYVRELQENRLIPSPGPLPQPGLDVALIMLGFSLFLFGLYSWAGLGVAKSTAWASSMLISAVVAVGLFLLFASFWPLSV
jgi:hypothetical protein